MNLAQVTQLINSNIIPNGNNGITANVLRHVLIEMLNVSPQLDFVDYKGTVDNYAELAGLTELENGDAYVNTEDGLVYVWNGIEFPADGDGLDVSMKPIGVVEEGNEFAVSGGEVFNNLPDYTKSKNLFNPATIQYNKYISTNNGAIGTLADWDCSALIPVETGDYYLSGNKERHGVGFYDSLGNPLRYSPINTGLVTVQSGEAFVAFNLKSDITGGYSNIQFERGSVPTSYKPYGKIIVKKESVEGLEGIDYKVDLLSVFDIEKIKSSTNLFDPKSVTIGGLLREENGTINYAGASSQYNTSDFIEIESTLYTALNINGPDLLRKVCFYDENKSYISGLNGFLSSFTAPISAKYFRFSVRNETFSERYKMEGYGVFIGSDPVWSYYLKEKVSLPNDLQNTNEKEDKEVATIFDIKNLINESSDLGSMYYVLSEGGGLTLRYDGGEFYGRVNNFFGYSRNDMFNFATSTFKGISVGGSDDVAPMHILNFTMGANHGYGHIIATIPTHGLTNFDIGTEFLKDGIKFYPLRIVDENRVAFLSQNSGTLSHPAFTNLTTGVITRGAEAFTITEVVGAQLYPSIGELNKHIYVNGTVKQVDEISQGYTRKLEVVESYVIYDPTSVLNNTIARAGQPQEPTMIGEPNVLVENIYRFVEEPACLVFANVQFLKEVAFADIMVSQAVRIGSSNATQYYVPNSNPLNGSVDLRKPTSIAWSSSIPATFVVNQDQPEPTKPPNRVIQYNGDAGFMLCYILTRGQGKNIADYTDRTFEIRNNSGKVYPHPVESTKVGATTNIGDAYSVAMARVYTDLSKTRIGNRLSIFSFTVDNEKHVYIDYSGSMIDKINLDDFSLNGKSIEVLESKNTTLKNNIYNQGFVVNADYVEGETCYIVLMIK